MARYIYRAKKGPTEVVEGVLEAQNADDAVEKVSRLGLLPVKIEEERIVPFEERRAPQSFLLKKRVPSREVTVFSRQLASLIRSGVPILRALTIIAEQSENPAFKEILFKVGSDVKEGRSFSSALSNWPHVFSAFYIAMVRSGEDSGGLQETLLRISGYRRKQEELASKVRTALAYPVLMALVGFGTVVFMFVFVMPKLMGIFANMGQALPVPTQIVIAISVFLKEKWPVFVIGVVVLSFLVSKTSTFRARKKLTSLLLLGIPVLNRFSKHSELSRFCRTLEVMLKSGIPILRAMSISIPVLNNEIIKGELARCSQELEHGSSFGAALKKSKLFPVFMVSLIAVGEESGKLDEALAEVADAYEHECDEAIKVLTSLLEPLMILGMGLIVGFIVVAMLLPIFQINVMAR